MSETLREYELPQPLSHEDVLNLFVRHIRQAVSDRGNSQHNNPIEFPVRALIGDTIRSANKESLADLTSGKYERPRAILHYERRSEAFFEVGWDLFRRGILTPTLRILDSEGETSCSGQSFRLTAYGEWWIGRTSDVETTPIEFSRFAKALGSYADRFGEVFQSRSHEALRAYHASLHLACCVMVGASTESVLLELLAAKLGDRETAETLYNSHRGLTKTINELVGQPSSAGIQQDLVTYALLVKPWRDTSAHADATPVGENHAYLALQSLLRLAMYAKANWAELTTPTKRNSAKNSDKTA